MKKILKFEVEEGQSQDCEICPFDGLIYTDPVCKVLKLDCKKYDFSTLKFIGEDEKDS